MVSVSSFVHQNGDILQIYMEKNFEKCIEHLSMGLIVLIIVPTYWI